MPTTNTISNGDGALHLLGLDLLWIFKLDLLVGKNNNKELGKDLDMCFYLNQNLVRNCNKIPRLN